MIPSHRIFLASFVLLTLATFRAAAADPVAISINTRQPGAAIAPDFLGLSYETSRMLPDDKDVHYFRPDNLPLLATLRTLGVKNLRIGGNSVDASLIAIPSEADVRAFFDFAKAAGVKVIYSVRLHSGDPAAAAKTARLIRDNYADVLESFSIGNEPDYYRDYDVYRARWTAIRDAMVAEFPGAKFCGPDQNPPDARSLLPGAAQNLYQKIVRDFASESGRLTQVTLHSYPFGCSYRNPRDGTEDILKLIPADAAESREKMLSPSAYALYEKIRQTTTASIAGAPVSLRLTETNSYWYSGLKGASDSYAAALWAVDYLHWWATHGAVGVNFHTGDKTGGSIMLPCRYAAFVSSGAGYEIRPLGYGMKLFALGGQGRSLPVSVTSATHPHLATYATLVDETTVTVTLINKEHGPAAANQTVQLKLDAPIGAEARIITLTTPDHDIAASAAGVTLGGAPIEKDGTWRGQWTALPVSPDNNREITVTMPPASAAVIKATLVRPDDRVSFHVCDASCAHFQAGLDAARKEEWSKAITEFSAVIEARSDAASRCAAHINRGRARMRGGDLDGSLVDFEAALGADPRSADALSWRASYWAKKGDKQKAIADCTQAIGFNPHWVPAYVYRATSLGSLKQYVRADEDYTVALGMEPQNVAALVGRALAREQLANIEGALADIETALRIDPTFERGEAILERLRSKQKKPNQSPEPTPGLISNVRQRQNASHR